MPDELQTIDLAALDGVTGGRITHVDQLEPALVQGIGELAKAVSSVGQLLADTKQQQSGQQMQLMQQLMQRGR